MRGVPAMGSSGLGIVFVSGLSRVPEAGREDHRLHKDNGSVLLKFRHMRCS